MKLIAVLSVYSFVFFCFKIGSDLIPNRVFIICLAMGKYEKNIKHSTRLKKLKVLTI